MVKATPVPVLVRAGAVNPLRSPTLLEVLLAFLAAPDFKELVSPPAAHRIPVVELRAPARQLRAELAALRKERDDLAERLAQIRSYQPGIEAEAKAWLAKIDRASRAIGETDDWPENN
jgi:hypothetical protein